MKRRIIKDAPEQEFIVLGSGLFDGHKYYGVVVDGRKGFITCSEYNSRFTIRCIRELTLGNGWTHRDSGSLDGIIGNCINGGYAVSQFDTAKELFDWIFE